MDFPISPTDLPWWGWLICAVVAAIVSFGSFLIAGSEDNEAKMLGWYVFGAILVIIALLSGVIGLVRLVKWAWG